MNVVSLSRYRSRDTIAVLEALLAKAREGEITGIALCYKAARGGEDALISGSYARSPEAAAAAAFRLSMKLANSVAEHNIHP